MSFMLTTAQFRARTKFVTRRLGWEFLRGDEHLQGVEKCQGLGKGGKIVRLGLIKIVSVRREPLREMIDRPLYGKAEAALEGFPDMDGQQFVEMFCLHNQCLPQRLITRIAFEYVG